jgi:hypothetical protein
MASYGAVLSRHQQALDASKGRPSKETAQLQAELLALEPRVTQMREMMRTCQEGLARAQRILGQKKTRLLLEAACTRAVQESRAKLPEYRRVVRETARQLQHQSATLREHLLEAAQRREERLRCERAGGMGWHAAVPHRMVRSHKNPQTPNRRSVPPYPNQHLPGDVPATSRMLQLGTHAAVRSHLSLYFEEAAAAAATAGEARLSGTSNCDTAFLLPPAAAVSACRPHVQRSRHVDMRAPPLLREAREVSQTDPRLARDWSAFPSPAPNTHLTPSTSGSVLPLGSHGAEDGCMVSRGRANTRTGEGVSCGHAPPRAPRGLSRSRSEAARLPPTSLMSVDPNRSMSASQSHAQFGCSNPMSQLQSHSRLCCSYAAPTAAPSQPFPPPMSLLQSRTRLGSSASTESILLIQSDAVLNSAVTSQPFLHAKQLRAKRVAAASLAASQAGHGPRWNQYAQGRL